MFPALRSTVHKTLIHANQYMRFDKKGLIKLSNKHKKRRPKKKGDSDRSAKRRALAQAEVLLIKSSNPSRKILSIRKILGRANYAPFFSWLREQRGLIARTFAEPFPRTLQELSPFLIPEFLSLSHEFQWSYCRLEPHLPKLAKFNRLRETTDEAFTMEMGIVVSSNSI